jgi:hypothetical protein
MIAMADPRFVDDEKYQITRVNGSVQTCPVKLTYQVDEQDISDRRVFVYRLIFSSEPVEKAKHVNYELPCAKTIRRSPEPPDRRHSYFAHLKSQQAGEGEIPISSPVPIKQPEIPVVLSVPPAPGVQLANAA